MAGGILEGIISQNTQEDSSIINALFDIKRFDRLKMITEVTPDLIFALSCLGLIAQRFNSKVLHNFSREFFLLEVSKDRQGRLVMGEALLAMRRKAEDIAEE